MTAAQILIALVLLQMLLALIAYFVLGVRRFRALGDGTVKVEQINLDKHAYPEDARYAAYAVTNQFELPVLFYVSSGVALFLGAWWLDVVLATMFVLSRYAHAFVHLTSNRQPLRFQLFQAGYFLIAIWIASLGVRLLFQVVA